MKQRKPTFNKIVTAAEKSKTADIDGSKIYDAFLAERFEEIYKYCMRDVKTTRNIWRRMNFAYPAPKAEKMLALAV